MAADGAVAGYIDPALHNCIVAAHNESLAHCFG
jgi:hypothetical protein